MVLAVGRATREKDPALLLSSFARLHHLGHLLAAYAFAGCAHSGSAVASPG